VAGPGVVPTIDYAPPISARGVRSLAARDIDTLPPPPRRRGKPNETRPCRQTATVSAASPGRLSPDDPGAADLPNPDRPYPDQPFTVVIWVMTGLLRGPEAVHRPPDLWTGLIRLHRDPRARPWDIVTGGVTDWRKRTTMKEATIARAAAAGAAVRRGERWPASERLHRACGGSSGARAQHRGAPPYLNNAGGRSPASAAPG
jgi:hypothetical protein